MLAVASCGDPFSSSGGGPDGGQAGQNGRVDASPQGSIDAGLDRERPSESGSSVNPNATIACSNEQCEPGPERCCMQNSNDLPDFCVGGPGQPPLCMSD